MKIQYCSDLHLEFKANENFLKQNPIIPLGEILILAGDILPFVLLNKPYTFFDFCSDHFQETYWIPGNHEYYKYDITLKQNPLFEKIRSNVYLVNNKTITYKQVDFICCTLWSKISPQKAWIIQQSISDFSQILQSFSLKGFYLVLLSYILNIK